ncbi:MAG: ParA family protein [Tetrasphaera sp.]|jgi:chromosome partitioning protein|nr:ParA family protein [Tetrasphaera sp.]
MTKKGQRPTLTESAWVPAAARAEFAATSGAEGTEPEGGVSAYDEQLLRFGGDVSRETPPVAPLPRPASPRVIAVSNQKGGVGKTSTAVNLAAALAEGGLTVLVIDMDPQGNASTALGVDRHAEGLLGVYDVLAGDRPLLRTVRPCPEIPDLWVAPATIDLAGAEVELVTIDHREYRLRSAVERLRVQLERNRIGPPDFILIDCPPSLGLLTLNALVAADEVLIPIQCEYYALEGLTQLVRTVRLVQAGLNPALTLGAILLTMYDGRTRLAAQVADEVRTHFPDSVLAATIPRTVRISEAPSYGQSVITYDPSGVGARAYRDAAGEVAARAAATRPGPDDIDTARSEASLS